ncbi:hypothetical protein EK904_011807 [Melospiza melodia maxima]|nr:hypothetical protein EK904_011807 [Melospiza melodia maxima]
MDMLISLSWHWPATAAKPKGLLGDPRPALIYEQLPSQCLLSVLPQCLWHMAMLPSSWGRAVAKVNTATDSSSGFPRPQLRDTAVNDTAQLGQLRLVLNRRTQGAKPCQVLTGIFSRPPQICLALLHLHPSIIHSTSQSVLVNALCHYDVPDLCSYGMHTMAVTHMELPSAFGKATPTLLPSHCVQGQFCRMEKLLLQWRSSHVALQALSSLNTRPL